jgi:hypothetical protein
VTPIQKAFHRLQGRLRSAAPWLRGAEAYVASGSPALLARVQPGAPEFLLDDLAAALALPPGWNVQDRRAVHVLAAARCFEPLRRFLLRALAAEPPGEDRFAPVRAELAAAGLDDVAVAQLVMPLVEGLSPWRPGSAVRFLLGLGDAQLRAAIAGERDPAASFPPLLALLLRAAPARVPALLPTLLERATGWALPPVCACLLERGGPGYEREVVAVFRAQPDPQLRFRIGIALDRLSPARHGPAVLAAARAALARSDDEAVHVQAIEWMVRQFPSDTLREVAAWVATGEARPAQRRVLELVARALGRRAAPVLRAALARGADELRLDALGWLLELGVEREAVRAGIERGMASSDAARVLRFLAAAERLGLAEVPGAWALLGHGTWSVREAAIRALAALGEAAVPPAVERLGARKAAVRAAAAALLGAVASPRALASLAARLQVEQDEAVRSALVAALAAAKGAARKRPARRPREAVRRQGG